MQVRIEDVSPVEKKLIVEVPWTTIHGKLDDAYRELGRSVQLPGFRKGKVPRSVLQRMYGKHVRNEVAIQLVRESFITANSEHNLQAVAEPQVVTPIDIKTGEPVSFEAIVEVKGEVVAKDYLGMELTRRPIKVSEEEVDKIIENLRREHTEYLPIEGRDTTGPTDVLTVKLSGTVGDQAVDQPQAYIDLGDTENDPLPGFLAALTGVPLNAENIEYEVTLPEDFRDPQVAGKTAKLSISILEARRKEIPEVDDEFAKDLDRGETVADLRQSVRAELEKKQEDMILRDLRLAALKELVKRNPVPVAASLVERGVEQRFQRLRSMFGGGPVELTAEMRSSLRPHALDDIRGDLLLESVADLEKVEVTSEAVDEYIAKMAQARNVPVARLRAELDRDDQLESLKYHLRREKTLELLVERASITEREPKPGELDHDHDHEHHDHDHHDHDHDHDHDHHHHHHDHDHDHHHHHHGGEGGSGGVAGSSGSEGANK